MHMVTWLLCLLVSHVQNVNGDQQVHTIARMTIPYPERFGACVTDSNSSKLIYFGGTDDSLQNETYKFNFTTMEWDLIGYTPAPGHAYRGDRYKDTYWSFGIGGSSVPAGSVWVFNLTSETIEQLWYNDSNATNLVPRLPGYSISGCAGYDSDRHVFWVVGGYEAPEGNNYTRIFNMTKYETGDWDNVWQYDLYGEPINGSWLIEEDVAPYYGACFYENNRFYVVAGIWDGFLVRTIMHYNIEEGRWNDANFTTIQPRSSIRADKWNDKWWVIGGQALGPRATTEAILSINVANESSSESEDFEIDYEAKGLMQCVYNDETFLAFGGTNDEESESYDTFFIIGANFDTYCDGSNGTCMIDCIDIFTCTDRNVLIDPYNVNDVYIDLGTLSGYGLTIEVGYNSSTNSSNETMMATTTAMADETLVDSIGIMIDVLSSNGNGYSASDMSLVYKNKESQVPIDFVLTCESDSSCFDSTFELFSFSNVTFNCYGNKSCDNIELSQTSFDYNNGSFYFGNWTLIENVNLYCYGNNSCHDLLIDTSEMIIYNLKIYCIGNNTCHNLEFRAVNFEIECSNDYSCQSATIYGSNAELSSSQNGKLTCDGFHSCDSTTVLNLQTYENLLVECSGNYSCNDLLVQTLMIEEKDGPNDTIIIDILRYSWFVEQSVQIDCNGTESCYNIKVFCPMIVPDKGDSRCIVNLNNYVISGDIYSISGSNYVELNCSNNEFDATSYYYNGTLGNETVKMSDDYGVCDNVTVHCGSYFDYSCKMEYDFDNLIWQCNGECSNFAATLAPTNAPTIAPTDAPSTAPSFSPTIAPTNAPVDLPTSAPSMTPTNAPTLSPTRQPTNYDNYTIEVTLDYKIYNITDEDTIVELFVTFEETIYYSIKNLLESNYYSRSGGFLEFYQFDITFYEISGIVDGVTLDRKIDSSAIVYETSRRRRLSHATNNTNNGTYVNGSYITDDDHDGSNEYDNSTITLHSYIYCIDGKTDLLRDISRSNAFAAAVGDDLNDFFNQSGLLFDADMSTWTETDLTLITTSSSSSIDQFYIFFFIVCGFLLIISTLAFLHARKKLLVCGCPRADGVAWWRVWIYGLQMWDLFSDINFVNEVIQLSMLQQGTDLVIFALAILSPMFVIVPYCANIFAALNMYKRIGMNNVARLYFEQRLIFFCSLVLLSGGVHASISLVCSRIFGISIFDCGLSKRELSQFTDLRVLYSVVLENAPQLIMQIIYIVYGGGWDSAVAFAMVTSLFSALVAVFAHCFRSQMELTEVIVLLDVQLQSKELKTDMIEMTKRMGQRLQLSLGIAQAIGVYARKLEVFYVIPSNSGCIIHIGYALDTNYQTTSMGNRPSSQTYSQLETPNSKPINGSKLQSHDTTNSETGGNMQTEFHFAETETEEIAFQKFLNACKDASQIPEAIKSVWKLSAVPIVTLLTDEDDIELLTPNEMLRLEQVLNSNGASGNYMGNGNTRHGAFNSSDLMDNEFMARNARGVSVYAARSHKKEETDAIRQILKRRQSRRGNNLSIDFRNGLGSMTNVLGRGARQGASTRYLKSNLEMTQQYSNNSLEMKRLKEENKKLRKENNKLSEEKFGLEMKLYNPRLEMCTFLTDGSKKSGYIPIAGFDNDYLVNTKSTSITISGPVTRNALPTVTSKVAVTLDDVLGSRLSKGQQHGNQESGSVDDAIMASVFEEVLSEHYNEKENDDNVAIIEKRNLSKIDERGNENNENKENEDSNDQTDHDDWQDFKRSQSSAKHRYNAGSGQGVKPVSRVQSEQF